MVFQEGFKMGLEFFIRFHRIQFINHVAWFLRICFFSFSFQLSACLPERVCGLMVLTEVAVKGVLLALVAMVRIGACASRGLRCNANPNQPPPRNPPPPVVVNTPVPHPPPPHNFHGHPNATKPPSPFRIIL